MDNQPQNLTLYQYHHLGCKCRNEETGEVFGLTHNTLFEIFCKRLDAKLLLKRVEKITDKELEEINFSNDISELKKYAEITRCLLLKGYDLFGLIDAGLASEDL